MSDLQHSENFEQILLSHTEMCYSVALALTHDQEHARYLAREVLAWAWQCSAAPDGQESIKTRLLKELRGRYLRRDHHQAALGTAQQCLAAQ